MMRRTVVVGALIALLGACGRAAFKTDGSSREAMGYAAVAAPPAAPMPAEAKDEAAQMTRMAKLTSLSARVSQSEQSVSMIVRNGAARIEVDSLETAIANARALAERLGGFVAGVNVMAGNAEFRQATLELRIPATSFDSALAQLRPLGEVESVQVSAEDVGEDYVDTESRLRNSRRLEERLIDLLVRRIGKLEEVLAVERELARVREEIERTEGHLRFLRARVSLSTLTLNVHEPEPLLTQPGANPIVNAVMAAGRNFVSFVAGFIAFLGYALPAGVLVAVAAFVGRGFARRWGPRFGVSTVPSDPS